MVHHIEFLKLQCTRLKSKTENVAIDLSCTVQSDCRIHSGYVQAQCRGQKPHQLLQVAGSSAGYHCAQFDMYIVNEEYCNIPFLLHINGRHHSLSATMSHLLCNLILLHECIWSLFITFHTSIVVNGYI